MAFGRDTVVERGGSGDKLAKVVMIQEKCITLLCCATGGGLCVCVCASVEKKAGVGRLYLSPLWLASPSVVSLFLSLSARWSLLLAIIGLSF